MRLRNARTLDLVCSPAWISWTRCASWAGVDEQRQHTPLLNFNSVNMYGQDGTGLSNIVPTKEWVMSGYATTGGVSSGRFTVT
jgi:hypothetical protein